MHLGYNGGGAQGDLQGTISLIMYRPGVKKNPLRLQPEYKLSLASCSCFK